MAFRQSKAFMFCQCAGQSIRETLAIGLQPWQFGEGNAALHYSKVATLPLSVKAWHGT